MWISRVDWSGKFWGNFENVFKSSLKFAYKSSFESLFDTSSTLNPYWILGLKISDSNLKVIFILCTRDWCIRNENFTLGDLFLDRLSWVLVSHITICRVMVAALSRRPNVQYLRYWRLSLIKFTYLLKLVILSDLPLILIWFEIHP